MPVLNSVKNLQFQLDKQNGQFTVSFVKIGRLNVREVYQGTGILYYYWTAGKYRTWHHELKMDEVSRQQSAMHGSVDEALQTLSFPDNPGFSGLVTSTDAGYIIAPTIKFDIPTGKDIALMLLSPKTYSQISVERTSLYIPDEKMNATATLRPNRELLLQLLVSGEGFRKARVSMLRGCRVFKPGFPETLIELSEAGQATSAWRPTHRNHDDILFAYYPSDLSAETLHQLAVHLGAPLEWLNGPRRGQFIMADGPGTMYVLRLQLERRLRRDVTHQTQVFLA